MNNYQEQAGRTNADLGVPKLDLAHMVLGVISELNELEDAMNNNDIVNISEEGADICWYVANYCTMRDYNFNNFKDCIGKKDSGIELGLLYYNTSKFADIVKKFVAYGKEMNAKIEKEFLILIMSHVNTIFARYSININVALQNNIAKLRVRFPNKFDEANAISRNLEEEHKKLSRN